METLLGQKEQDMLLLQSQGENNKPTSPAPCLTVGKAVFLSYRVRLTLSHLLCREHAICKAKGKAAQPSLWIRTSRNFSQLPLQLGKCALALVSSTPC